jgi:hypothetical protein
LAAEEHPQALPKSLQMTIQLPGYYAVRYRPVCQAPLSDSFDLALFESAKAVHEHLVEVLGAVHAIRTETVATSATKRMHLYFAQLLNDTLGAVVMLAGHGMQRPLFGPLRSSYEYVARALYFTENSDKAVAHLTDLWHKEQRLFEGLDVREDVKQSIEESVSRVMEQNPDWTRPHDLGLKDMLVALYGADLATKLYKTYHVFYSPTVHGYFDAVPSVIAYENGGTIIKPGPDIANAVVCIALRVAFTMICLMKRNFGVSLDDTQTLYRQFCDVRKRLTKMANPFPMTQKMLAARR